MKEEALADPDMYCCFTTMFIDEAHTIYLKGIPGQSNSQPPFLKMHILVTNCVSLSANNLEHSYTEKAESLFCQAGGKVYYPRDFDLLEWKGALADEETSCPESQLKWWKVDVDQLQVKLNGLDLSSIVECLFICKVREVRSIAPIDWVDLMNILSKYPIGRSARVLLVKSKRNPKDLMSACQTDMKNDVHTKYNNPFVYVYIKSKGVNLNAVFSIPSVDTTTSTCINAHVMTNTFGIANSMMSFVHTIKRTFDLANQSFHPCRVQMMCDHLTVTGQIHGVDHTGMAKREDEFLTQASLERMSGVFIKYSLGGATESTNAVSPATVLGGLPKMGSGMNSVVYKDSTGTEHMDDAIASHAQATAREEQELPKAKAGGVGSVMAPRRVHVTTLEAWKPPAAESSHSAASREEPSTSATPPRSTSFQYDPGSPEPPTSFQYNPGSPEPPTSISMPQDGYLMYTPTSPRPSAPGPETLSGSMQKLNIAPEQQTPRMLSANNRLERHVPIDPKVGEVAPDLVLRNIAVGMDIDGVTGYTPLDEEGNVPFDSLEMEALKGVTPKPQAVSTEAVTAEYKRIRRGASPSLSDSSQGSEHPIVTELEEEPPSLYGIHEDDAVVELHAEMEEGYEDSLPDLPDDADLEGGFTAFEYNQPMSEIAKMLERLT